MSLILNSKKNTLIIRVRGDFDLVSVHEFREKIDQSLEETMSQNLLLDLSEITFIDSSGIGVILGRYRKVKANHGQMVICGTQPAIEKIFKVSGIISLMPICSTEKEAWKLLEQNTFKGA
ncbi:MAG: anti-sigma factor antagonist [Clostridia bacterium]|nr:anti-sigma factor antagonist [Clostridia bacterium]MDD4665854.1 anti-sigma factor antagonist [Clostridia bacterium]